MPAFTCLVMMAEKKEVFIMEKRCVICNRGLHEKNKVVFRGRDLCFHCSFGIAGCFGNITPFSDKPEEEVFTADNGHNILSPRKIYDLLGKYVIGQDRAKKSLANAAYTHFIRTSDGYDGNFRKSNVLLYGPTGCGKTYLVQRLAKILDVPLVIGSATSLTEAGYEGEDVSSLVERLYLLADGDLERAQKGIIFIDEIDKLCVRDARPRVVGVTGVQQELLTMMEGTQVKIKGKDKLSMGGELMTTMVDTTDILFICGGAFPDLQGIVEKRLNVGQKKSIGFGCAVSDEPETDIGSIYSQVTDEDLHKFGMIPEFVGRVPVKVGLEPLDKEALCRILSEPKDSLISQYSSILGYSGVTLAFQDDALDAVAGKALAKGTGARALRSVMEEILQDVLFQIPDEPDVCGVVITKECVLGEAEPILQKGGKVQSA